MEEREREREWQDKTERANPAGHQWMGRLKEGSLIKLKRRRGQVTEEHARSMILLCAGNTMENDEAMAASMRGLELRMQCVNSGYADELHPPTPNQPKPEGHNLRTATVN